MKRRKDGEHDERAWVAWHVAALQRVKKFPRLRELLSKRKSKVRKSADDLLAIAKMWDREINRR